MLAAAAPRRPVVPQQPVRQTIEAKSPDQPGLDRLCTLIPTGGQQDIVPGVIIQGAQGMATALPQGKMPLEVHLPKLVGSGPLEPLERCGGLAACRLDEPLTVQDASDRA